MLKERECFPKKPEVIWSEWASLVEKRGKVPQAVVIEVTTGCSAGECSHCYISAVPGKGEEMSPELAFLILKVLAATENQPNEVWVTGGEPGVYPYLEEVVQLASRLRFSVCIVTNGEPFAKMELVEKVSPYVNSFAVTLRSFSPLEHQMMMEGVPPRILEVAKQHWQRHPFDSPEAICQELEEAERDEFLIHDHHRLTIQALGNLWQYKESRRGEFALDLNHDVFNCRIDKESHGELYRMLLGLKKEEGIVIDNVWLQVLAISGRAVNSLRNQLPQICWLTPSFETILTYINDQQAVKGEGLIRGETVWIDPISSRILEQLELGGIGVEEIPGYRPEATPAFDVRGNLRDNVLCPD